MSDKIATIRQFPDLRSYPFLRWKIGFENGPIIFDYASKIFKIQIE